MPDTPLSARDTWMRKTQVPPLQTRYHCIALQLFVKETSNIYISVHFYACMLETSVHTTQHLGKETERLSVLSEYGCADFAYAHYPFESDWLRLNPSSQPPSSVTSTSSLPSPGFFPSQKREG